MGGGEALVQWKIETFIPVPVRGGKKFVKTPGPFCSGAEEESAWSKKVLISHGKPVMLKMRHQPIEIALELQEETRELVNIEQKEAIS